MRNILHDARDRTLWFSATVLLGCVFLAGLAIALSGCTAGTTIDTKDPPEVADKPEPMITFAHKFKDGMCASIELQDTHPKCVSEAVISGLRLSRDIGGEHVHEFRVWLLVVLDECSNIWNRSFHFGIAVGTGDQMEIWEIWEFTPGREPELVDVQKKD